MRKLNKKLLILVAIVPVGCLAGLVFGYIVGGLLWPVRQTNTDIGDLGPNDTEQYVLMVAGEYAADLDVGRAIQRLGELEIAAPQNYVALLAEEYVHADRGRTDADTVNIVGLADALGVSSPAMVAYVATATPPPTETPTPLPTATPTATLTATPIPTDTPVPTNTAEPDTQANKLPEEDNEQPSGPPPPTATPAPPTETPTAEPPPTDFVVKTTRMFTIQENGGCRGSHQVMISVLDVNGNPLKGAVVTDLPEFGNFRVMTGDKDEPVFDWGQMLAEVDLYKNSTRLVVAQYPQGNPVTSEVSGLMSSNDWEIGIPLLIEKGYCTDEAQCRRDWNSGVAGNGANALCWGHYSWWVEFQATHAF